MAAKNMSNCFLCGAEYEVCKMCSNITQYTPWRKECDTMRHWQIYMIVKEIRSGILTEAEAKEQLDHLKVTESEVKTFVPSVQETLSPIFKTTQKPVEKVEPTKSAKKGQTTAKEAESKK